MNRFISSILLTCVLALTACQTVERQYYVLTPTAPPTGRNNSTGIGIGPVIVADYLVERPYVAFQSTPNRVELSELHEWAGDLRDDFSRTLGTNLGRRMGTGNIRTYPWDRESEIDYQVTVEVHRFHGTSDGDALLEVSWRAYSFPGPRLITSRTETLREPLREDGFDELVAAQSRLVDQLAARISRKLKK